MDKNDLKRFETISNLTRSDMDTATAMYANSGRSCCSTLVFSNDENTKITTSARDSASQYLRFQISNDLNFELSIRIFFEIW